MKLLAPSFLLAFLVGPVMAQRADLQLRTGPVAVAAVQRGQGAPLFSAQRDVVDGRLVRCLLFDHTLSPIERDRLVAMGVHFLSPLRPHAWVVSLPANLDANVLLDLGLQGVHVLRPQDKLDPRLTDELAGPQGNVLDVLVMAWPDQLNDVAVMIDEVAGASVPFGTEGARHVHAPVRAIQRLLAHPGVQWIESMPEPGQPEDLRGRAFHRINRLGPALPNGTGLDGEGVTVVVNDDGFVGPHIDFKGRTQQDAVASDLEGTHGDMVAGIIGAAGNVDPHGAGMAPASSIIVRQYEGGLPNTVDLHVNAGAMIFNSSYSDGCNAGYTTTTRQVDDEIFDHPALMQVFSAGNEGENDCGYGAGIGWGTISGGHKIGKNVIAAANLTDLDALVGSSSRGPSADGRIKPDISSFGNGQMSNAPDNAYMTGSGTSAASPGIAGVLALLYQGWRNEHGTDPPSALLKALLLNTADDLGNTGPDYKYGWGAVNGERAWRAMVEERWTTVNVSNAGSIPVPIDVPAGIAGLRVMAYWMDPAGPLLAANALVNDIDLQAIDPSGGVHLPWSLSIDPSPAALNAPAVPGADHLNNMEQVVVNDPLPGTWTFVLSGFDVPQGPQEVFLLYEFLPQGVNITWPDNGEHIASSQTHRFRWDTPDHATPVTFSYSINGGASWNSQNLLGTQRYFDLGIGDTALNDLRLRVQQGAWSDEHTGITTMRTPVQLTVPVNCVDSALLQWPTVTYASAYIVHKLTDRYMVNVDTITTTSYWFTGLTAQHDDWFAVTAIGPDPIIGERSIAIARPQQLVACQAQRDLVVQQVLAPTGPVILCQPQDTLTMVVHNAGLQPVDGFTAGVIAADNSVHTAVFSDVLAPGADLTITLPDAPLNLMPGTMPALKAFASGTEESFVGNDTLAFSVVVHDLSVQFPYAQDFEQMISCTEPTVCSSVCPLGQGLANGINGIDDVM
ncbi:MAG TPA: S8 family serine peptidase, partial [Flavobacteriales bacterium]|nr:S8 family serine peptidase [Flavobacteriales bacterium]